MDKLALGWREWVQLPELGIDWIKAKIDSGARTSALHADDIRVFGRGGRMMVAFIVHPRQRSLKPAVELSVPLLGERRIRSSNGETELRPVIETRIRAGAIDWPIEMTLTRRDCMGFRMLLGRQALRGHVVIDPGRSYLAPRPPRRKK